MDLLTILASEFEIPIIHSKQKIWFFRTKAGLFYFDFLHNGFIALGWDLVSPDLVLGVGKNKESKKEQIKALYPEEKRPGLISGQMDVFYNEMQTGDLVIIPAEGSKAISIGKIGNLVDNVVRENQGQDEYPQCTFMHKRNVEWLKAVDSWQDIYLFKALRAQQTISDITDEASLVLRNLYPIYISGDQIHFTLQKSTNSELSLASNVDLLVSVLSIADNTAALYGKESFRNELALKTAVGSPGFLELILPFIPVATITIGLIKWLIGKEKTSDGSTASGLLALIARINDLVNDYHNRKKTDAETRLIDAQVEKTITESALLRAQIAKMNAETRQIEMQNSQISILPSGITTEEERIEQESLTIPNQAQIDSATATINDAAGKFRDAAASTGLCYAGKKIDKVS